MLIASTSQGVCAVRLGDSDDELVAELRDEFSAAMVEPAGDDEIAATLALVGQLAEGQPAMTSSIPLDLQGTAFQTRVWEELRGIASGTTVTYGEIAARIGRPTATRTG